MKRGKHMPSRRRDPTSSGIAQICDPKYLNPYSRSFSRSSRSTGTNHTRSSGEPQAKSLPTKTLYFGAKARSDPNHVIRCLLPDGGNAIYHLLFTSDPLSISSDSQPDWLHCKSPPTNSRPAQQAVAESLTGSMAQRIK